MRFTGATMGTTYAVTVVAPPAGATTASLKSRVETVLDRVNGRMSTYRPDSELSRVNQAGADTWVPVSPALIGVLEQAKTVSAATGGAFDVTVGPLVNLWGFGPQLRPEQLPKDSEISARRRLVGMDKLRVRRQPPAVRKAADGVYVDLSAIAKGYGVDRVAEALERAGAQRYLVEVGGELYGRGKNGRNKPWSVAVERPEAGARRIEQVVRLAGAGMATSGDYRNFFTVDGRRYSHTIDPRTGRPVTHNLHSVTVIAPTTARADAMATALLVMGPDAGREFASAHGLAALFIVGTDGAYTDTMTRAFKPYLDASR